MRPPSALAAAVLAVALASGCTSGAHQDLKPVDAGFHPGPPDGLVQPGASLPPLAELPAPSRPFAVGSRQLDLVRGHDRPLRTVVWYPAAGGAGGPVRTNAKMADGRFPLVLFSHGLTSSPEAMRGVTTRLAAAGFVVAAPAYPFTSSGAAAFRPGDVANQPGDASSVITAVLKRDAMTGDLLAGHLDPGRVGAAGHSAGGFTTAGLLSGGTHDGRVRSGVIISGGLLNGPLSGPATPVLFVHGDNDHVVRYAKGRAAYDKLDWPKGFVTVVGGDHTRPVSDPAVVATMIDFFRWSLYGDATARSRLAADATVAAKTRYESAW